MNAHGDVHRDRVVAPEVPNLRHLRVVEAVGDLGSISMAAQAINLSQPAVTQAVAKIEAGVGRPLFERRQTGTFLTDAGEVFLNRVRRFLDQCDRAFQAIAGGKDQAKARHLTSAQVRCLLVISRSTSFSQAAHTSGISTASLHRSLRELEALLPCPLYTSSRYGLRMTEPGAEFARRLALATREIEAAYEEIAALDGFEGGRVQIGALPMSGAYLIGACIVELTRRFPHARVSLTNAPYNILANSLRTGEIDLIFGVLRRPDWDEELSEVSLFSDSYCIVGRAGHPLAARSGVTKADLLDYEWVTPGEGTPRRREYHALFEGCAVQPRVSIETSSLSTIRAVLACSDRLALVSRHEVDTEQRLGLLSVLAWASNIPSLPKGISCRANWLPTPIQKRFLELLKARAGALVEDERPLEQPVSVHFPKPASSEETHGSDPASAKG